MNIVSLSDYEKARKSLNSSESITLLNDVRHIAVTALSKSLSKLLNKASDTLFELSDKAFDRELQNLYLETRARVQTHRIDVETRFKHQLLEYFNKRIRGEKNTQSPLALLDSSGLSLSLVEEDDFEETLAVSGLAKKLKTICREELNAFDQRMACLIHDPELKDAENPLSPDSICKVFNEACELLSTQLAVKKVLFRLFEEMVFNDALKVYQDINHFLIEKGVLPKLPSSTKKRAQQPANTPRKDVAGLGPLDPNAVAGEQDLFATFQQLMMLNMQRAGTPMTPAPAGGMQGSVGTSYPNSSTQPAVSQSVIEALTKLQQGNTDFVITESTSFDISKINTGTTNVLREIKATNVGRGMDQVDSMIIDIVAMLFDYIFEDKNIPDVMKALIGRLQIPILKVAILDKKFFSTKSHPTRKLLDTLAHAAIGWNDRDEQNDSLFKKVDAIIQRVLHEFDDNINVFAEVLVELQEFLQVEEEQAKIRAEASENTIRETERLEMAKAMSQSEIRHRLEDKEIPEVVRQFLSTHWECVLFLKYAAEGKDGEAWKGLVETMDDLIWSVAPKRTTQDRKRLVSLLPKLLKRLKAGLEFAGVAESQRDEFFTSLVACHAAAVKSDVLNSVPPTLMDVFEPLDEQSKINRSAEEQNTVAKSEGYAESNSTSYTTVDIDLDLTSSEGDSMSSAQSAEQSRSTKASEVDVDVEEITINDVRGAATLYETGDEYSAIASSLTNGTWVEFMDSEGNGTRAKLAWISPLKGIYLFTNRHGEEVMSLPLFALAAKLRDGSAQVMDDIPLFDRAVSAMIGILKKSSIEP